MSEMILTMFTDWSATDNKYFYIRGFMLGVILTLSIMGIISSYKDSKKN